MKLRAWIRLAFLIVAAVSIAMTVTIDDGSATVKTEPSAAKSSPGAARERFKSADAADGVELRVELERLARSEPAAETERQDAGSAGIFSVTSWYVPPPPPPPQAPPPPPRPTAPPLPFSYLGRYQESEALLIILVKGDRLYTVSPGEVIENTYRVDGIASGRIELTYLPLNIKQTLDTGEAS